MSSIFGGSSSKSSSSNQAYPYLQGALGGNVSTGTGADSQIASLLGLNGNAAQNTGFQNFNNSTGYQFGLNQGMQSITGGAATQGLLNSGSTLKALDTYGQNYANTQYQNYLNPLMSLVGAGNTSAGIIGGAGQVSNSSSNSNPGISSFIGQALNPMSGLGSLLPKGGAKPAAGG